MRGKVRDRRLEGQVALVTGAGRRLGRTIALALAQAGADVVVHYSASKQGAEQTAADIAQLGRRSLTVRADVSRPAQVRAMFRRVERKFNRLDLLVNNSGIFFPSPWDQLTEESWDRVLGVNLKGTFFCAQCAAKMMKARAGGRIINISSLGGVRAWPDYSHYCASKAGVIMLTRCLAKALAPDILVNSIAPGTVLFPGEKLSGATRKSLERTPLKRAARPEDISNLVVYLATSGESVTGQTIVVDGGQSA